MDASRILDAQGTQTRTPSIGSPVLSREGLLDRYRGTDSLANARATNALADSTRGTDLSRERRNGLSNARAGEGSKPIRSKSTRVTDAESRSSERKSQDKLIRARRENPRAARKIDAAGAAIARVAGITSGITLGCGTGNSWYCDSDYPSWGWGWGWHGGWGWNGHCGGWGSWWGNGSWAFWPWSCYYWNSYHAWGYPGWSSNYCSWYASPAYYSSVIYVDDPDPAPVVVYVDRPVEVAAEPISIEPAARAAVPESVSPGAPPSPLPETQKALQSAASEYLTKGDLAFREGRFGDAVQHYARAVEYAPNDGVLWLILSDALFATGDYHYCAFALRRALELDAKLYDTVVDKTGFYSDPSAFTKQLALAESYLQDHFLDEDARLVLAANYLSSNRSAQAADLLESAFSLAVRESPAGQILLARARTAKVERASAK